MQKTTARPPGWMPKVAKEAGIGMTGSLLGTVLNYGVLITVTRRLTPDEFGTFALAQSVIAVALVFVLCGTPRALDRFIPYFRASGEQGKVRGLLETILRLNSRLGIAVAVALLLASSPMALRVFDNPDLLPVLRLMVISIPALASIELIASSFAGFKELRYRVYTQQVLLPLLKIGLAAAVLSLGYGLLGWVGAYLVSLVVTSVLAWSLFRRRIWTELAPTSSVRVRLGEIMSYCWPLSVNNIVLMLSANVSVLMLGAFRPESEVGIFRVYVSVAIVVAMVNNSFGQIYKPVVSEFVSTEKRNEVRSLHRRVAKWTLIAASFLGLVILLLGKDILSTLIPEAYLVHVSALMILAVGRVAAAALGPQAMALEAFGNTRLSLVNALLMLAVILGLGRLLIPDHGVRGAAIAVAAGGVAAAVVGAVEVYVLHRLHAFSGSYLRSLAAAACAGVGVAVLTRVWSAGGLTRLAALFVVLAGLYAACLKMFRALDTDDHAILGFAWSRLTSRR